MLLCAEMPLETNKQKNKKNKKNENNINFVIELAEPLAPPTRTETKQKYEPREPLSDSANKTKSPKTVNLCVFLWGYFQPSFYSF